ncbi:hypothetical protein CMQ_5898 [Grosmannia clavigera kw1407]|uniref:Uncharacterized protein n=1 Tax=Grosmannia clavigera (strain kw1407 / UAMH 11150) TaxID=655863 RepID=F0XIG7_GROCL|nr:uncharacterized protein CMQ_5898 [Grosmannia clavigera kw1407]EFX02537.1 hypothetical protein CMQ_5898 [Grosmannia clavigera kw1407]
MTWPETEVLVHISAPSKASDDVRYHCLAQAYLDFGAARRLDNIVAPQHKRINAPVQAVSLGDTPGLRDQFRPRTSYVSPNVVIPDSQPDALKKTPASRISLNNSFGSLHDTFISDSQDGSIHGKDTSPTEEHSPDLSLIRKAPNKRKSSLSRSFTHQLTFAKRVANARRGAPGTHYAFEPQNETQSSGWEDNPSSAIVDFSSALELTSSLTENIPSSLPDELERIPATSSPIVYGRAHRSDADETAASAAKDTSARKSMQSVLLMSSSQPVRESYHTSLRILPPEPALSCAHLDVAALVTDELAKLAHDLDLARRYRPSEPAVRVLRPFERGFWKVNTSSWTAKSRHETWEFLAKYVGQGSAGWGVWCSRDEEPHAWLRLHCFAAVAGHTYLLLYAASKQVQDMEVAWLDALGTPVIVVSPKKRRRTASGI